MKRETVRQFAQLLLVWIVFFSSPCGSKLSAQELQLTIIKNGVFSSVTSADGEVSFIIIQNGQFTNWVDEEGNVCFTMIDNGGLVTLVDQNGESAFNGVRNGAFLTLSPTEKPVMSRTEIHKENRRKVEVLELTDQSKQQDAHKKLAEKVRELRNFFPSEREILQSLGFLSPELDRYERILEKLEIAHQNLARHNEPVRIRTGIGESNADFERRHKSWRDATEPDRGMVKLCEGEMTKYVERYDYLSNND